VGVLLIAIFISAAVWGAGVVGHVLVIGFWVLAVVAAIAQTPEERQAHAAREAQRKAEREAARAQYPSLTESFFEGFFGAFGSNSRSGCMASRRDGRRVRR
jgi:threonine dehydrogenase-like Zn-dependent dehydrogenase